MTMLLAQLMLEDLPTTWKHTRVLIGLKRINDSPVVAGVVLSLLQMNQLNGNVA